MVPSTLASIIDPDSRTKAVHYYYPIQVRQRPRLSGVLPAEQLHGGPGVGVPVGGGRQGRVLARAQGLQPAADQHARGGRRASGQSGTLLTLTPCL